jgi:PAS domain S-box-containing protein
MFAGSYIIAHVGEDAKASQKSEKPRDATDLVSSLLDHAQEVILMLRTDATVRYANRAVERLLGHRPQDLHENSIFDYLRPGDVGPVSKVIADVLRDPSGSRYLEFQWKHKDGLWRSMGGTISNLLEDSGVQGLVAAIWETTERERLEEAFEQSKKRYRAVVEQSVEAIYLFDPETKRILETNPSCAELLNYAPEELREMTLYDIVAHDRESVDLEVRHMVTEGRHFIGERRYRRKDETLMDVEVSASVVPYGSREVVCILAHDVTERRLAEKGLQRSMDALLAIYEAGHILGSTLEAEEIGTRLLHLMKRISSSVTAVISVPDDRRQPRVWHAVGFENLWRRARFTPEIQAALRLVIESGKHTFSQVQPPEPHMEPLPALFLPLKTRNRTVGVLEIYGPQAMTEQDLVDILLNLTTKAASALENARLYEKLANRERQLQELVGKLLVTQEEERRLVAYEVHDGPTQVAVAAYHHLQAFAKMHPPDTLEGRKALEEAVELTRRTVGEARQIIAHLRPTVLDDFGLATAIRSQVEGLRAKGWQVDYDENVGDERLPNSVESALYRVAQEALVNVLKHARSTEVRITLRRLRMKIRLQIRDWGAGLGSDHSRVEGPGERVGLSGMRERVALVGGSLRIHSKEGVGTLITADVPLPEEATGSGENLVQRLAADGHSRVEDYNG